MRLRRVGTLSFSVRGGDRVSETGLRNLARDQRVARLRSESGADLVALLTLRQEFSGRYLCGIGFIPGGTNGRFYRGAKDGGFSVSAVNCGSVTPVHEWGITRAWDIRTPRAVVVGYTRGHADTANSTISRRQWHTPRPMAVPGGFSDFPRQTSLSVTASVVGSAGTASMARIRCRI